MQKLNAMDRVPVIGNHKNVHFKVSLGVLRGVLFNHWVYKALH